MNLAVPGPTLTPLRVSQKAEKGVPQTDSRIAPRAPPTKRLELFLRQLHVEPLAPAPAPTVALNAAIKPMAVVVDLDEQSLAAVAGAEVLHGSHYSQPCRSGQNGKPARKGYPPATETFTNPN